MANGFDLTKNINLRDPEILQEFREILDRREASSLTGRGASNKIKEKIGERQAIDRLSRRFPGAKPIFVIERPNGVPILDVILRQPNGEFVVIEAKFSSAGVVRLGRTNDRMWVPVEGGWKEVPLKRVTTQMSPKWIEDRLAELRGTGVKSARRLAGELNQALREGRFNSFTVVTDSTGEVLTVIDNTPEWRGSFMKRGAEFRPVGPAAELAPVEGANATGRAVATAAEAAPAELSTAGSRGVANRLATSATAAEGEALAAGRAASVVAREGGVVAARQAVKGAATAVGRSLVGGLLRIVPILNVVGWVLFAVDVISWISEHYREKAIEEAVEKALRTNIPDEVTASLGQYKDEIARSYARTWLKNYNKGPVFLYLSPRMVIEGTVGENGYWFVVNAPAESVDDIVSTKFIEPKRRELKSSREFYYMFEIRWSAAPPIYTPFDIYRAFTEFWVEHIVDSWAMHYGTKRKLSARTVKEFYRAVEFLAHMSAILKYEPWFGFVPADRAWSSHQASVARWEALQELSKRIEKELIPTVVALESQGLINPHTVRLESFWAPIRSELDPRLDESLSPSMSTIALDMRHFDSSHLEYERFETLYARQKSRDQLLQSVLGASIEGQKAVDLREFLKPVQKNLPASLAPVVPWWDLTGSPAGEITIGAPE